MRKINELKAGVILSYFTIIVTVVVGLLVTPYMLKKLGQAEYGLYAMIGSLVGTFSLLDFGLNHTIIRYVAKYHHERNKELEKKFLGTIFQLYFFISLILLIIGGVLYFNLNDLLDNSLTTTQLEEAKTMFLILVFNLVFLLPGNAFEAISAGYEKYFIPRLSKLIKYIVRSIMVVAILFFGSKAVGIVILDTLLNIVLILVNAYYVIRKLQIKIQFGNLEKFILYEIFGYSIWIFLYGIATQFQWKLSNFLIGIKTDTNNVAIMSIAIMLTGFYGAFGSAILGVFLPRATKMIVNNASGDELTDAMIRVGRLSLISQFFILGGFILFGKQFILLWIGRQYVASWIISLLFMTITTVSFTMGFGSSILEAKKKVKFRTITFLFFIFSGLIIGYISLSTYGLLGMVYSLFFALIGYQLVLNFYYNKVIKINIIRFWKNTFLKFFILVSLIVLFFSNLNIYIDNWMRLLLFISIYTLTYIILVGFFGINNNEKEIIKNLLWRKQR